MQKIGFDSAKYLKMQSEKIKERIEDFGGKLYLEFGGKLFDDFHASRVLPGFAYDSKVKLLCEMKDQAEIIIVINATDIEKNKVRGDLGITYDLEVMRLIDAFGSMGLYVGSVLIAQYSGQRAADAFRAKLESLGIKSYIHYPIEGYPMDVNFIVSDEGFGKNDYIETTRPLVVVTAPGPGSGKMATCLSQLFHENKRGVKAGYAKFETFPIWNLPLTHPVNLAYEAATADLDDVNMIDHYHLAAYGEMTVNYNRDIEVFPVLNRIFETILGESPYKSPTDMGVNMVGNCICDDEAVCEAAKQEIVRRFYDAACDYRQGKCDENPMLRIELLMERAGVGVEDRPVVAAALEKAEETSLPATSIQLKDGKIVVGKTSSLLGSSAAMLINALKEIAGIDDSVDIIDPLVMGHVEALKKKHLGHNNARLHLDEALLALAVSAPNNPNAAKALDALDELRGCECHSTVILSQVDTQTFKKLGLNLTCEPKYRNKKLYHA